MKARQLQVPFIAAFILIQAAGFITHPSIVGYIFTAISAMLWLIGFSRLRNWAFHCGFILTIFTSAYAIFTGIPPIFSVLVVLFSLTAWDLSRFLPQMAGVHPPGKSTRIVELHSIRLGWTMGLGAVVTLAAVFLEITLTFRTAIVIALAAVILLTIAAKRIIRSTAES